MRYSYKRALETLMGYAMSEGYVDISLNHKDVSEINYNNQSIRKYKKIKIEPNSININGKLTIEQKVYVFLHELGHHELRKNWKNFKSKLPAMAHAEYVDLEKNDKKYKRRNSYRVSLLEEEFLAWDEGLKLGKELGIRINFDRWISIKSQCLKSYIDFYGTLNKKNEKKTSRKRK